MKRCQMPRQTSPESRRKNTERMALVNESMVFETLSCVRIVGSAIRVREEMDSGQLGSDRGRGKKVNVIVKFSLLFCSIAKKVK